MRQKKSEVTEAAQAKAAELRRQAHLLEAKQATIDIDSVQGGNRHHMLAVKINELLEEARKVEQQAIRESNEPC